MYKLIIVAFISIISCGTPKDASSGSKPSTENVPIANGQTIIALNDTAQIGNLQVHFKEVLEDSRCPTGTTCIWQGRVKVLVETSLNREEMAVHEIIFGELRAGETKNHLFYITPKLQLKATAVNPYPKDGTSTTDLPYEIVLEVTAL